MKIDKRYKLQKAISKDDLHPALQHIFSDGKVAVATDGNILACVPLSGEGEEGKYLFTEKELIGKVVLDEDLQPTNDLLEFPDYTKFVPKDEDAFISVRLNANPLRNLILALGVGRPYSITMQLYKAKGDDYIAKAIKVTVDDDPDVWGLIMPLRPKEEGR